MAQSGECPTVKEHVTSSIKDVSKETSLSPKDPSSLKGASPKKPLTSLKKGAYPKRDLSSILGTSPKKPRSSEKSPDEDNIPSSEKDSTTKECPSPEKGATPADEKFTKDQESAQVKVDVDKVMSAVKLAVEAARKIEESYVEVLNNCTEQCESQENLLAKMKKAFEELGIPEPDEETEEESEEEIGNLLKEAEDWKTVELKEMSKQLEQQCSSLEKKEASGSSDP